MALQSLEGDASRIQKRLYSLVGAVEKAGFIPAAIALYFASTKIMAGSTDLSANFLTGAIFGLYGGAFLGHRIVEALSVSVSCQQEAKDMSEKRKQLSGA